MILMTRLPLTTILLFHYIQIVKAFSGLVPAMHLTVMTPFLISFMPTNLTKKILEKLLGLRFLLSMKIQKEISGWVLVAGCFFLTVLQIHLMNTNQEIAKLVV